MACSSLGWIQNDSLAPEWHGLRGSDLAGLQAPPFTAVAQQSIQSLALQSTDGVCSTLPHLLLSFNCRVPVASRKLHALLKHLTSYRC